VCGWQKMTLVRSCKKTVAFGSGFTKLTAILVFPVWVLRYMYARNEVLPCWITLSAKWLRTRSEEMQHEENYFDCVDPIMLEDELWMRQCEKLSTNHSVFENRTAETEFSVFEVGSVFRKDIWHFHRVTHTPINLPHIDIDMQSMSWSRKIYYVFTDISRLLSLPQLDRVHTK